MATWKTFEEIEAWQQARALSKRIYLLSQPGTLSRDFKLRDQMNSSSGSIMDNIAEGFDRGGNKEFVQFLSIAKGSAGELKSQLYRASDRGHMTQSTISELVEELGVISNQIGGLIHYLNGSDYKGPKFIRESEIPYLKQAGTLNPEP